MNYIILGAGKVTGLHHNEFICILTDGVLRLVLLRTWASAHFGSQLVPLKVETLVMNGLSMIDGTKETYMREINNSHMA